MCGNPAEFILYQVAAQSLTSTSEQALHRILHPQLTHLEVPDLAASQATQEPKLATPGARPGSFRDEPGADEAAMEPSV